MKLWRVNVISVWVVDVVGVDDECVMKMEFGVGLWCVFESWGSFWGMRRFGSKFGLFFVMEYDEDVDDEIYGVVDSVMEVRFENLRLIGKGFFGDVFSG